MGCECYQVSGCIGADPDCPAHGTEAQRLEAEAEAATEARESRIATLERRVSELEDEIRRVRRLSGIHPSGFGPW